jgi:small subunit ribosomal protein S8
MTVTDPIADMLTQIRNAISVRKEFVVLPHSKLKLQIANLLKHEGYLTSVETVKEEGEKFESLKLGMKYSHNTPVIQGIKRVSSPGQRIYEPIKHIRKVLGGTGINVVSTSKGIMSDHQARDLGIGGEVLFTVW